MRGVRLLQRKVRPSRRDLAGGTARPDRPAQSKPTDFGYPVPAAGAGPHFREAVIHAIDPKKDVDAFHPVNVGKIMVGNFDFVPCTPAGVMELIDEYQIDPKGKECVVVGRSNIVGKPMAMLAAAPPRHSDHVPQPHPAPGRGLPPCRHSGRRGRQGGLHHAGYGKGRRGRDRRRHQPQRRGQGLRRRGSGSDGESVLYDAGCPAEQAR